MAFKMAYTKKNRTHPESYWVLNVKNITRSDDTGRIEWAGYHNEAAYMADKTDILDQKAYAVTREMTDMECHDYALSVLEGDVPEDGDDARKSFFADAVIV